MIGTRDASETPRRRRPGGRPGLHPPLRPGPRGRRLRPGPGRATARLARRHPGRRLRGCPHRAPRAAGRPPARLRRADAGRAHVRHDGPVLRGRVAVHTITGGSDLEQRRDGDYLGHDERYTRTDEYLDDPAASLDLDASRSASTARTTSSTTTPPASSRTASGTCRSSSVGPRRPPTRWVASTPTPSCCGASRSPRPPSRSRRCGQPATAAGRTDAADQRLLPADHRADRGARLGARAPDPGQHPERAGHGLPADGEADDRRQGPRRTTARGGCSPPRPRATCTTGRCGPRRPRRPAPAATPPRWSAARRPSRWPCSTTSTSASTRS